ncbi:hypothetical protein B0I37DRAFT_449448 [Chaetomium sp. MPI-CAGE-AT-0009]|nr:hypothetical protein B0I37DRAFT_449448 [Chaetomium sp. MPI-CAGE-AT-0009]
MARAQSRKRARADDPSQPEEDHSYKRIKSRGIGLHQPSNFPPEFWDNLSKVPLTRRALRELDRRNGARPAPRPTEPEPLVKTTDRVRFSRHGGPDIRHLRGFLPQGPEPKRAVHIIASNPSKTKPTSVYDDAFEQHAIDHGIYPEGYDYPDSRPTPKPENVDQLRLVLFAPRASLSLSQFPDSAFENFKKKNKTVSESSVKRDVIPIIAGNSDIPNVGDLYFTNMESITGDATIRAVPDFFDGARAGAIHDKIRNVKEEGNLNKLIIPTKHASAPVAPNFFLETKAPGGGADVVLRQALHDGAIGARAMHALQNYGAEEPAFDGNAYTYSSTYHGGALQLYAHHVTPPTAPGGRPEYHMTKLRGFDMTDTRETFVQGATAFRNARDLAQRHRDSFIQAANARARQSDVETPPTVGTKKET